MSHACEQYREKLLFKTQRSIFDGWLRFIVRKQRDQNKGLRVRLIQLSLMCRLICNVVLFSVLWLCH
jgi:hypothetical protein